jgi:hypothetical protein
VVGLIVGATARADDAEDKAAAFVEKFGGEVERASVPGRPVIAVVLVDTKIMDEGLKELAAFQSLDALYLFNTQITDAGLKELVCHKKLKKLYLGHTKVTDAGLKQIAKLTRLTTLFLADGNFKWIWNAAMVLSPHVANTNA